MTTTDFKPGIYVATIAREWVDTGYSWREEYSEKPELLYAEEPEELDDGSICDEPRFVCGANANGGTLETVVLFDPYTSVAYITDRWGDDLADAFRQAVDVDENCWTDEDGRDHTWGEAIDAAEDLPALIQQAAGMLILSLDELDETRGITGAMICDGDDLTPAGNFPNA